MAEIVIPKSHLALFARLVSLDQHQRAGILGSIRSAPVGASAARIASDLAVRVPEAAGEATSLVEMFAAMYRAFAGSPETTDSFATLVTNAAQTQLGAAQDLGKADWDGVTIFVSELMRLDGTLGVVAKVAGIVDDRERTYCKSRILTDVRPIFGASVTEPPNALAVVHTLRLTYHVTSDGMETDSLFVALELSDLEDLQTQIERAVEKEKTLKALLGAKQLHVVDTAEIR